MPLEYLPLPETNYVTQMRKILFITAAVVAMAVLAMLVWDAPKRPGADPTEPTAAQAE
ncbi:MULTISPECIES: hypothetical protein [unclassified Mesorhizobium]|uniref:hypothetical protein n=1 Tax=unclassified Mesorhizobium TaxID=325217 RepID=UPI000B079677|nr:MULTISPECIES: hypothetical protein [unclassified Mesorhizobium]QIA23692.1 hypothetical protein A9K68_019330 [Mesorhizobium sp. AA22]